MGEMADMILGSWDPMDYDDYYGSPRSGGYRKKPTYNRESLCPACESPMVKREGPYGMFAGCSAYPNCRETGHWEELPEPPPPVERKSVSIEIEIPIDNCPACKFHSECEVFEVGFSPNEHWCTLFDKELSWDVKQCSECKKMQKNGKVSL
jgi:ssDNA-binding Zn-finger/Zn-ribbon topoisomerase 1